MKPTLKVLLLVRKDTEKIPKLLVLKQDGKDTFLGDSLKFGEKFEQAAHRIALKQAGVTIRVSKLICIHEDIHELSHSVYAVAGCEWVTGVINTTKERLRWEVIYELKNQAPETFFEYAEKILCNLGIRKAAIPVAAPQELSVIPDQK